MVKRKLKKICVIISLICLVASFASVCSSAVDPITMNAMAAVANAFGMQYGIGTTYSVANASGVESSFQDMWDEFQTYQSNQGDSFNYQDYYDNFNDKDIVQSFSHSSGKFSGFHLDSDDVSVFTKFWNWLLSGPAQMVEVDNQYAWNIDSNTGTVTPINIYSDEYYDFNGNKFAKLPVTWVNSGSFEVTISNNNGYVAAYQVSGDWYLAVISSGSAIVRVIRDGSNYTTASCVTPSGYQLSRQYNIPLPSSTTPSGIPIINFGGAQSPEFFVQLGISQQFTLNDVVENSSGIDINPYKTNDPIILPDISNPTSIDSIDIVTNIPWDDSYDQQEDQNGNPIPLPATDVPNIVNDWIDSIQDNTYELEEAENVDPQPPANEVYIPFLPVALPSFNFSFSGIWHYVREWVSSLGSFFTTLFTIWAALPYEMVVPVYATAVVVIVLGVYKRFFM